MTIDTATITAIFGGLATLLGAFGALAAVRTQRVGVRRREHRALQRVHLVALGYIFVLKGELAERGIPIPAEPRELADDDDDDPPPPPPARAPAVAGA